MKLRSLLGLGMVIFSCTAPSQRQPALSGSLIESERERVVGFSLRLIGKPYRWEQNGPDAFDCSGFVHFVLSESLGRDHFDLPYDLREMNGASAQSYFYRNFLKAHGARREHWQKAQRGDVIFFPPRGKEMQHIGIVTRVNPDYEFTTAQREKPRGRLKAGVQSESFSPGSYWGSRKPEVYRNVWIEP